MYRPPPTPTLFPTRRSSDLTGAPRGGQALRHSCRRIRPSARRPRLRELRGRSRDRKSTRLNSSHEWISYAVFCLKKKKNIEYEKKRYEVEGCIPLAEREVVG